MGEKKDRAIDVNLMSVRLKSAPKYKTHLKVIFSLVDLLTKIPMSDVVSPEGKITAEADGACQATWADGWTANFKLRVSVAALMGIGLFADVVALGHDDEHSEDSEAPKIVKKIVKELPKK